MENKTFKFKLIDMIPYKKGDVEKYRIITYCYFGFNITFYVSLEKAKMLMEKQKQNNFDINDYINVFYDNTKQQFAYIINIK